MVFSILIFQWRIAIGQSCQWTFNLVKMEEKRPDLLCRDKLGGNFRDTWKCNWIWLKLLKKSSCAVTEVNSFSFFYAKGGWNLFNFAWYFRQQSFTVGIKEKYSAPVLTLVPADLGEPAWQWVCIYCSQGRGSTLVLSQAARRDDILMLLPQKRKSETETWKWKSWLYQTSFQKLFQARALSFL